VGAIGINTHWTGQCRDGKRHQHHEQHQHRRHHQQHELVEQAAAKPRTINTAITTTGRRSKSARWRRDRRIVAASNAFSSVGVVRKARR
jgi:hypothetical protein